MIDILGLVSRHSNSKNDKNKKPKRKILDCEECSKKEPVENMKNQKFLGSSRCLVCQNQLAFIPQLPLDVSHRLSLTSSENNLSTQHKHNTAMPGTSSVYRDLLKQFNMICKYIFILWDLYIDIFIALEKDTSRGKMSLSFSFEPDQSFIIKPIAPIIIW